jgi:NADH-quinone oxidoreductase subunit N
MPLDFGAVGPEIVVVASGLLLILLAAFVPVARQRPLAYLAVAGLLAALALTWAGGGASGTALAGMVRLDPVTTFFRVTFLAAALLVTLTGLDFVQARGVSVGEFYGLLLLATAGALFMAMAWDVVTLYIGLELLSALSYVLAGFFRDDAKSHEAGMKYFLNGALASAVLLFGLSLAFGLTGTTAIDGLAAGLGRAVSGPQAPVALLALGLVLGALGFKVAAVPFHLWAPDTYEGAPTPFAGFLAAVSEAAGMAAIIRVVVTGMAPLAGAYGAWLAVLAALTMTLGNVTALWQSNIKRMMAYSSIAQVGYVLVGLAVVSRQGLSSVLFYLFAYLFMTLGVFAVISALSVHGQGDEIADYAGLGQRNPALAALLTLFFASLVGIPTTAGFMGKLNLLAASVTGGYTWLALLIAANSAVSVGYYWQVVRNMWLRPAPDGAPAVARPSAAMGVGLAVATLGVLVIGLLPNSLLVFAHWASFAPGR